MQTLSTRHSYDTIHRALRLLGLQLSVRAETQELGQEIDALRQKARTVHDAWDDAFTRRVAATANIAYRDKLLDKAVVDLARDVAAAAGGDLTDSTYRLLFPHAASKAMRPVASDAQAIFVKALLARLGTPELADWAERAGPINERFEALQAEQAARADLYAAEAQANATRQVTFDEVRQAYNVAYSRLRVLYPKDKALVESFFASL